jgi:ABC-type bacteriocin/lantibiotic exporter with double-glycine peptidase domain
MNAHSNTSRRKPPGRLHALALALLVFPAAGCAGAGRPPAPLSDSAVRLDLPLVHQDALYDCGLASISALCQYWSVSIPDAQRASLARTAAERNGLSGDELRSALEDLGFETYLFAGSLDRTLTGLYGHVDAGRPPLVMLSGDGTTHHYELVLGYDEARGNLILLDPRVGEVLMPVAVFERNWKRCQRFTLLASRAESEPEAQVPDSDTAQSRAPAAHDNP